MKILLALALLSPLLFSACTPKPSKARLQAGITKGRPIMMKLDPEWITFKRDPALQTGVRSSKELSQWKMKAVPISDAIEPRNAGSSKTPS